MKNSYYGNVNSPWFVDSEAELITRGLIAMNGSGRQDGNSESDIDPSSFYSCTLDPAEDIPGLLRQYTGTSDLIQY